MVFACQKDSFLKEFNSTVISCQETEFEIVESGKKERVKGYAVVMEDTILFPEGGGQPWDQGYIDEAHVKQVIRQGSQALHFTDAPLPVGKEVKQKVNWERRFDHMQQHSGQHLISAIGENVLGCRTTAWWLGSDTSFVELDTTSLKQSQIQQWENIVNEKIRDGLPVITSLHDPEDPTLEEAHTRGLPSDHTGPIRMITIQEVDRNMCCGTHVNSLSQLQVIKFLHCEKGKKNKVNLHFLVGDRVIHHLSSLLTRESSLTALLKNGPTYHVDLVDKLQKSLKSSNKKLQSTLKDLAVFEAQKFMALNPLPSFYSLHRNEGDHDFMRVFLNEVGNQKTFFFLTVGDERGAGQMTLNGDPKLVADVGPKVCEILKGKGAGSGSKFQAKVTDLSKRSNAENLLKQHIDK